MEDTRKELIKLMALAACFTSALGSGEHDDLSMAKIEVLIASRDLFGYLEEVLGYKFNYHLSSTEKDEFLTEWSEFRHINTWRQYGESKRGLSVLNMYVLESIRRRLVEREVMEPFLHDKHG